MFLIIGLGNPGSKYKGTRHNIGFAVVERISDLINADFVFDKKSNADIAKGVLNGKEIILFKPRTFMNESGMAAKKFIDYNKLSPNKTVVVHDDLDIPFGDFKISFSGSTAGHKGLESLVAHLGTPEFWRLRIGIANKALSRARALTPLARKKEAVGGFVLSRFGFLERLHIKDVISKAIEALTEKL